MPKRLIVAALIFVAAFAFGVVATPDVAQAADCYYTCSCNGTPLRCCTTIGGGVSCKVDTSGVWQCPQVNNC